MSVLYVSSSAVKYVNIQTKLWPKEKQKKIVESCF